MKTAFDQMCQTVGGFFSSLWNTIVGVFAGAGRWFQTNVVDAITLGFKNMVNGAIGLFESMLNGIIQTLNWIIGKVNSVLNAFGGNGIKYLSKVKIARFAEGGFPDQGQLFIAREAGAEMVGSIGRRAAVANNDQIVEGISSGVSNANEEVIATLFAVGQQIIRAINEKDSNVYLDKTKVSLAVTKTQGQRARMYGV